MLEHAGCGRLKQNSRRVMTLVLVALRKKKECRVGRHSETTGRLLFPPPPLAGSRGRSMVQRATVLKRRRPCQVGISPQNTGAVTVWCHAQSSRWSKSLLFAVCTLWRSKDFSEFMLTQPTRPGFRQRGNARRGPGKANAGSQTNWWAAPECGAIHGR